MEEFYYFLFLCFITVICAFQSKGNHQKVYNIVLFVLIFIYFLIVRNYPHDDMHAYRSEITTPIELMMINIYFIREFLFWGTSSVLYSLVHSELFVFLLLDIVGLIVVFLTRRNFKLPTYYIPLFYLSFPGIMGAQNIYRQFLASIFFLAAMSYLYVNDKKTGCIFLLIAPFLHNSVAVFFPILILISDVKNAKFWFFVSCIGMILLLPQMVSSKSNSSTGLDLIYLYVLVVLLSFLLFYITQRIVGHKNLLIRRISFFLFILTVAASILMGGAQSERIGITSIQILIPFIILLIESHYKPRVLGRLILILIFLAPSFLFGSVLDMLTNYM